MSKKETKKQLKYLARDIRDIQIHYEDYSKRLDEALSEALGWIEEEL